MRTTITLNNSLYRALKIRAAQSDETISKYVEDAIKYQVLEDLEDLEDVQKREHEAEKPFDDLVNELRAEGLL